MSKPITAEAVRPSVSDIAFSKIPFGPVVCRLRPGTFKVLAAIVRSSWVDSGTRRRVSYATNRQIAELAAVTDPQTVAKHLAELKKAGAVSFEEHDHNRVVVVHERADGIGDMFVSIPDSHLAWRLNAAPFMLYLAVRLFDSRNLGYSTMRNRKLAERLNWSDRAVKRAMGVLRSSGLVETKSIFNPSKLTRKRIVYALNPTPNPEQNGLGGYEKAVHLCGVRKSGPPPYEKVAPPPTKKWPPPLRKSGPLNTNSENEFLERTLTTNQPTIESTGQSERAETVEAKVVVVEVKTSTDTDQEPKAKAEAPPELSEVVAILAESKLARDEQERYLKVTRKMVEPPPMAWHRRVLNVQPSSTTRSLAGVVISRLKEWMTTPPEQRAAIVEEVLAKDAEVIAKRLRSAKFGYETELACLKSGQSVTTSAEVRRSWERYNAALAAAGQPAVQLPNEVLHAEEAERKRAAIPKLTIGDMMAEHAKREQAVALAQPERTPAAVEPPPPVDPAELERRRRERAERERAEAIERERKRIEDERNRLKAERAKEIDTRTKAFEKRELLRISRDCPGNLNDAVTAFRTVTLPAKRVEFEAAVRAEFAPKFAALAPTPPPTRKPPGPPPGPPATIPAMASR